MLRVKRAIFKRNLTLTLIVVKNKISVNSYIVPIFYNKLQFLFLKQSTPILVENPNYVNISRSAKARQAAF